MAFTITTLGPVFGLMQAVKLNVQNNYVHFLVVSVSYTHIFHSNRLSSAVG